MTPCSLRIKSKLRTADKALLNNGHCVSSAQSMPGSVVLWEIYMYPMAPWWRSVTVPILSLRELRPTWACTLPKVMQLASRLRSQDLSPRTPGSGPHSWPMCYPASFVWDNFSFIQKYLLSLWSESETAWGIGGVAGGKQRLPTFWRRLINKTRLRRWLSRQSTCCTASKHEELSLYP